MPDFIIMRHGEAHPPGVDPERGLTGVGREAAVRTAERLAADGVRVDRTLHSGKKRAAETAEILHRRIGNGGEPEVLAGLRPGDAVEGAILEMQKSAVGLAVVGHLPHLGRMIARLLGGDGEPTLRTAEAVHLRRTGDTWKTIRVYPPE
ncbi:MAG: phosphohistidine phosphatase SixA [Candidatus Eisenbacteria bacterium]|nr:phosphohistidine phosphatase SixA [Candidatus Eisenbacteria bacterium]